MQDHGTLYYGRNKMIPTRNIKDGLFNLREYLIYLNDSFDNPNPHISKGIETICYLIDEVREHYFVELEVSMVNIYRVKGERTGMVYATFSRNSDCCRDDYSAYYTAHILCDLLNFQALRPEDSSYFKMLNK